MSSNGLEGHILRYKIIYSATALILGVTTALSGWWLGGLEGYHTEAKGLLLHVFGCAILYNNNNMYPSLWLIIIGVLVVILTQYRIRTNRKVEEDHRLDRPALRAKFMYSIAGLFVGLLVTIYGLTFAESGTNLCPATLVPDFPIGYFDSYLYIGVVLMVVGIIIVRATRFRIKIYKNPEVATQSDR
jgi:uncharacterized membrane protein YidH (DUF202 family)